MPELPEVEATRRHLQPAVEGSVVEAVEVRRARMIRRQPRPADFGDRLVGRTVLGLSRLGKFLLADVEGDLTWVIHLGMSGRMALSRVGEDEAAHTNVVVRLAGGVEVRMVDPRTFGFMAVYLPDELALSPLARLGRDALDDLPSASAIEELLGRRTAPIKALLLDQRILAGLGNIYADEVLFRAGVMPQRPGGSLSKAEVASVRAAIVPVLTDGIAHGGTSLDDLAYLLPDGAAGEHLARLAVYGREDLPCRRCGTPVRRRMLRQRSTHWCPECQR